MASSSSSSPYPDSLSSSHVDESSSLLRGESSHHHYSTQTSHNSADDYDDSLKDYSLERYVSTASTRSYSGIKWGYNAVLLVGIFLVNADSSVLLAMFRSIASDFNEMDSASWVITSYVMGMIVAQPFYGKLSDIYGRKPLLLIAYSFYCVGGFLAGTSVVFWAVLLGRVMAGIGNAGITALVSTMIVDMVPPRSVAVWRSYVYAVNQVGRAIGPPAGGLITDKSDWRWALLFQVPLNILGMFVIWWKMPIPKTMDQEVHEDDKPKFIQSLRRIDFVGAIILGCANIALLMFFDRAEEHLIVQRDYTVFVPLAIWVVCLVLFIGVEGFWVREPILPLRLMVRRNVLSSYLIQFFQTAAQMGLYTSIPLYFRTAEGDSNTKSSLRLLFITAGTVLGGLISGFSIQRSGLYRLVTLLSLALSNASFLSIFLRWRGSTSWGETAYGFPVGLGFGVSLSAAFIGLTAGMEHSNVAIATSGFYLSLNLGSLIGVSAVSLLIQGYVRKELVLRLAGFKHRNEIIRDALSNLDKVERFGSNVVAIVQATYVESLTWVWLFSLLCGCLAFASTWIMKEGQLDKVEKGKGTDRSYEDERPKPSKPLSLRL